MNYANRIVHYIIVCGIAFTFLIPHQGSGETPQAPVRFDGHVGDVKRISFNADGSRLSAFGADRLLINWSFPSGVERFRVRSRSMDDVIFSGDNKRMAVLGPLVHLRDTDSGRVLNRVRVSESETPIFLNHRATTLITAGKGALRWIDTRSGREKFKLRTEPFLQVAASDRLLGILRPGRAELRRGPDYRVVRRFRVRPNTVSIAIGPANRLIAFAFADGLVELHDARTGDVVQARKFPPAYPIQLRFHPKGKYLAIQGHLRLFVWNIAAKKAFPIPTRPLLIRSTAFSPSSEILVCGFRDGHIRVYNLRKLQGRTVAGRQ